MKFSPEIVHESCHGKCREISGEISLLLVPLETKLENAQNFSRQISRRFSRDNLQLQMPNFMAFFILQTFVLEVLLVIWVLAIVVEELVEIHPILVLDCHCLFCLLGNST